MSRQCPSLQYRIEVTSSLKYRSRAILAQLPTIGISEDIQLKIVDLYFVEGDLSPDTLHQLSQTLLCDPVTDQFTWQTISPNRVTSLKVKNDEGYQAIEVLPRPGVTDNTANELLHAADRLGIAGLYAATTGTAYQFFGNISTTDLHRIARSLLVNNTIQRYTLGEIQPEFVRPATLVQSPEIFDLTGLDDEGLLALSQERRLALDLNEMRAIKTYFNQENRSATDAELETIAQTWSEHCVHKTFRASIRVEDDRILSGTKNPSHPTPPYQVDNILKTYLRSTTEKINAPWVRSAFIDNAGVIEFDDEYDLSFKVETHNHPSAIEPFGGANTGTGGVVRDVLGVSHRPIAATDVLCFGPIDLPNSELPKGVLHPARIRAGVVAGIGDYGNKLGLPTVNGAVVYHPGYISNPLVYAGCVGLGPRNCHPRRAQPGDRVIVIGGKTGRDGLRGATFSSLIMDAQTGEVAGASVQIGDPITEKGTIEVVSCARDLKLYNAITDCGAGGLSSAIGETASEIGAKVDLAKVPLKYAGLAPWEIWLSEAQERMVLAVPPENLKVLQEICDTYWIQLSDIGEYNQTGRLEVLHGQIPVVNLKNEFLHQCPRRELKALISHQIPSIHKPSMPRSQITDYGSLLTSLLAHPNIASKESIIRVYDHEVRGSTIIKPLVGLQYDGPSDAAVLKPLDIEGWRGFVLANGINPLLSEVDPYTMAISVIDEAIRNAVAVGADPGRIAILDNFCWGDPLRPETLGSLVRAAQGCQDAALHYGTPFISGKDSLNNEFTGSDGTRQAIPGTLLVSSIGIHLDVRKAITMDLKETGNRIYLIGDWIPALLGSHALNIAGQDLFADSPALNYTLALPKLGPQIYSAYHKAIHDGLVRSAHDLSEGGLAVAAAEMCIAGRLGAYIDLSTFHTQPATTLFAETNGCLLVEVSPHQADAFEACFTNLPLRLIGQVTDDDLVNFTHDRSPIATLQLTELIDAFKGI